MHGWGVNGVSEWDENEYVYVVIDRLIDVFWGVDGHSAIDRNPGPGYNTLLLQLIPWDLYNACPHRQFHTLPSLLHSQALLDSNFPACVQSKEAV